MTINEFVKKYNLHDSLMEDIKYDSNSKTIKFIVDFCYWQQDDYREEMPETGLIIIEFSGNVELSYIPYHINSDEIIRVFLSESNTLHLIVFNDLSEESHEIIVKADDVSVKEFSKQ